jgi:hypothetical protein
VSITSTTLSLGKGGWASYRVDDQPTLSVRFQRTADGRRLAPVELYLAPGHEITARSLRELPLARLEIEVNTLDPEIAEHFLHWLDTPIPGPREALAAAIPRTRERSPASLRKRALIVMPHDHRGPHPDEFYQGIARVYGRLAAETAKPAVVIAEANDVPLTTVHRWVKEARQRGHLPPTTKGRRG